ncbi:eukaryotic translation initiation factor 3 subunit D-like [Micractinium conductrix]|uniref:Eukaryotic translation initiation factor 3 subunit D-like n=1 Tax=Micractinium conductrix TaxID=554055 RepID=A0A2P6UYY2_9CHLO|nr:eukaryotic translation initiation factor 3 subunit D-like [Micractinium conductrix]|eukprot:PSC67004.1 eukaryotic translation initiation factor 3 subunit D-like [Micractinium conductrix]
MPLNFVLPPVEENQEGWGPIAPHSSGIPMMPFSKSERLGRIADFGQQAGRGMFAGRAGGRPEEPAGRGGRGGWGQQQSDRGGGAWQQGGRGGWGQQGGRGGWGGRGPMRPWDQPRQTYSSSVDIKPEWQVLGDIITLAALNKLSKQVGEPEELTSAGALAFYDKAADRVTPKNPAKLRKATARTRSSSASEDPIMRRLVAEGAADIFMTDDVMCALMCAPRSQYPWDVNGETAPDPLPEEKDNINGMQLLSMEATGVVSAAGERQALKESAPAGLGPEGTGYKYLKFSLGDSSLIVRCAVDAAIKLGDSVQTVAVHALNEFDPKWSGVDWRQKLENQRGAVLATELKNNANKIAKWTAARAGRMNLNMDNCWGIVSGLSNLCNDLLETEGKYLLVRDPNKPQLTLYALTSEDAQQYAGEAGAGAAAAADQED